VLFWQLLIVVQAGQACDLPAMTLQMVHQRLFFMVLMRMIIGDIFIASGGWLSKRKNCDVCFRDGGLLSYLC
jgi:hypothetical protein